MKLLEILRFEAVYQLKRPWLWLFLAVYLGFTIMLLAEALVSDAQGDGFLYNAPTSIAALMPIVGFIALLVTAALGGDSATRDAETRMDALLYPTPVGKVEYLMGRFLGAFVLNALALALVPLIHLVISTWGGLDPEMVGPFRARGYIDAWLVFGLPNAFIGTALVFAGAVLARRSMAAWGVAVVLFMGALMTVTILGQHFGRWTLARFLDPSGYAPLRQSLDSMAMAQRNVILLPLGNDQLTNRLLWVGIAALALGVAVARFRFEHHAARGGWLSRRGVTAPDAAAATDSSAGVVLPVAATSFGAGGRIRQVLEIARRSFIDLARSPALLALLFSLVLLVFLGPEFLEHLGVPFEPRTLLVIDMLAEGGEVLMPGFIVPVLIMFFAGELVWRDRDARTATLFDAAPVRDGHAVIGRFLGLALLIVVMQALIIATGVIVQTLIGYNDYQIGLYAKVLLGLELVDYLLFAALAMALHTVANQKYAGHLLVILVWAFTVFAGRLGVEHNLFIYATNPSWTYSDMAGFGASIAPFLWFRLWWVGWALLLGVAMRLLWVRGVDEPVQRKLGLARRRLTGATAATAAFALAVVLVAGGFTFYNTNIRNHFHTTENRTERRVAYERLYGRYAGAPQPLRTAVTLRVELYPSRGDADVTGTYLLANRTAVRIDTIHLAPASEVETTEVRFDRGARLVVDDADLHHRIYALDSPLQPGDSLRLDFRVHFRRNGFRNDGVSSVVQRNGTSLEQQEWLPDIGYQRSRELSSAGERRVHGLPARTQWATLENVAARSDYGGAEPVRLDVTIGTEPDQIAATAGTLQRTWSENGRRYFRYVSDTPIPNNFWFFSAAYAVRDFSAGDTRVQILYHPGHALAVDGIERAARASLEWFEEAFGEYPHRELRIIEYSGQGVGASGPPTAIAYREGYALMDSERDHRDLDFAGGVMAHEIAHQWWGDMLLPARVEGGFLVSESLAWYSAMGVIERMYDREHLRRLLAVMRDAYLTPRARAAVPLVRAADSFLGYRKGPFAMYALREYVGEDRVNGALRSLLEKHQGGQPPLATSLDLYAELQAVTPDSLRYLLDDLLLRNTYWDLAVDSAHSERVGPTEWRVTMDVRATKAVVDTAGVETDRPMNDVVEIGVFPSIPGESSDLPAPLYLERHRIRSGPQRIVVTVHAEPALAGIDPYHLLIETSPYDNTTEIDARP